MKKMQIIAQLYADILSEELKLQVDPSVIELMEYYHDKFGHHTHSLFFISLKKLKTFNLFLQRHSLAHPEATFTFDQQQLEKSINMPKYFPHYSRHMILKHPLDFIHQLSTSITLIIYLKKRSK
jgi:hypothetical protein